MNSRPLNRSQLAERLAADLPDGSYVNLGIGLPTKVADYAGAERGIIFHTENGLLGVGRYAEEHEINTDLINAGKIPVTLIPGASLFDHAQSFGMIRGGHLDYCVLGAYQVSSSGDIANWKIPGAKTAPAVGGAMDLVLGAKNVYVMTDLLDKHGNSKLVKNCNYPLTGVQCVNRVYTDRAIFQVVEQGFEVLELFGSTIEELRSLTGLDLQLANNSNAKSNLKETANVRS